MESTKSTNRAYGIHEIYQEIKESKIDVRKSVKISTDVYITEATLFQLEENGYKVSYDDLFYTIEW